MVVTKGWPKWRGLRMAEFVEHLTVRMVKDDAKSATLQARNNLDFGWGRCFGGQIMAQALSAASQTVPETKLANSFSCKFLREGHLDQLPQFHVEKVRDGRSFTTRRVRGFQDHGDIIDMLVSYHKPEPGYEHQHKEKLPTDTDPEALGPNRQRYEKYAKEKGRAVDDMIPKLVQNVYFEETEAVPVAVRPTVLMDVMNQDQPLAPVQQHWLKANKTIEPVLPNLTKDQLNQVMLAFMSDFGFMSTALFPHMASVWQSHKIQASSLSHTMYFHRPIDLDNWHLFDIESPFAGSARGFVRGEIYNHKTGQLVCSATQEGLIRRRTREKKTSSISQFS